MDKKKVLIVMGGNCMGVGGIESMVINYYRRLNKENLVVDFVFFGEGIGLYDEEIKSNGGRIFHLPIKSRHPLKSHLAMKKLLIREKYDIVHANLNAAGICSALKIAKQCGIPVRISHAHSTNHGTQSKIRWILNDLARKRITGYSTHNFACSDLAGEWYYGSKPYEILPNAVETAKFAFDSSKRESVRAEMNVESDFVIGHVGNLGFPKNQSYLLEIFAAFKSACPKSKLWLVGEGEDLEALNAKAKALKIENDVCFLGKRNDVDRLLQGMDAFVLPSFFEGFPVVVAEAVAADLPCFVSDSVTKTVVLSDRVEMLSINDSADLWAKKIMECIGNVRRDNTSLMKQNGFDIDIAAERLNSFYLNGRF